MDQIKSVEHPDALMERHPGAIIYKCIAGSKAYGTARPGSDEDICGIFMLPHIDYFSLKAPPNQVSDERGDMVFYTLKRFLELASTANPNIIELLFMPEDCILHKTPVMDMIIAKRDLCLTR